MKKIITAYVYPPIPTRIYDWSAARDGYELGDLMGYGETEDDAVGDLLQQEKEESEWVKNKNRRYTT